MTVEGATTGTPAYMAPELAMGDSDLDARVDLYGLGCVAYWLITGSLVFEEKSAAAMMLAHLQKAPIAPSMRNGIAIPAGLDRTIMMCLAKKPADRPASAEALADLLEGCGDVGSWTPEDAKRWWHANMAEGFVREDGKIAPISMETVDPDALTTL